MVSVHFGTHLFQMSGNHSVYWYNSKLLDMKQTLGNQKSREGRVRGPGRETQYGTWDFIKSFASGTPFSSADDMRLF